MARGRHPTRIHIEPPSLHVKEKYLRYWYGGDILRDPDRFPKLTSEELFGNSNPLEIDFGCGMGVLTCNRAQQNPELNIIGIDISQKPLFCAINDANSRNIDNIKFIRSNFNAIIPLLKPFSIRTAYYLFPNPPGDYVHPRANAGRKRFLETIYTSLAFGGKFIFATDSDLFFSCISAIINNELYYGNVPLNLEHSGIMTWYQRIWESRGKEVWNLVVEKTTPHL